MRPTTPDLRPVREVGQRQGRRRSSTAQTVTGQAALIAGRADRRQRPRRRNGARSAVLSAMADRSSRSLAVPRPGRRGSDRPRLSWPSPPSPRRPGGAGDRRRRRHQRGHHRPDARQARRAPSPSPASRSTPTPLWSHVTTARPRSSPSSSTPSPPAPRRDARCDNERVNEIWQSCYDGTPIQVYPWETRQPQLPSLPQPDAGPPEPSATDPHFVVTEQFGGTTETPTITFAHPDAATTTTVRVRGDNWFVVQRPDGERAPGVAPQHHRLGGPHQPGPARAHRRRLRVPRRPASRRRRHLRVRPRRLRRLLDQQRAEVPRARRPAPLGHGSPSTSPPPASRRTRLTPSSPGRRSPSTPTTSAPGGAVGPVTYTWRFQRRTAAPSRAPGSKGRIFEVTAGLRRPRRRSHRVARVAASPATYYARVDGDRREGHMAATRVHRLDQHRWRRTVTLARDCACSPSVACNNYPHDGRRPRASCSAASRASPAPTTGSTVRVDWGDGTGRAPAGRLRRLPLPDSPITLDRAGPASEPARLPAERHAHLRRARPLHGHGRGQEPDRGLADQVDRA